MVSHGNAQRLFNWRMADASLLLSPDIATWRASLEEDPHAAMKLRHAVEDIEHTSSEGHCTAEVREGAFIRACGKPLDAEGRCPDGHEVA
jgi:hypothetical protein